MADTVTAWLGYIEGTVFRRVGPAAQRLLEGDPGEVYGYGSLFEGQQSIFTSGSQ